MMQCRIYYTWIMVLFLTSILLSCSGSDSPSPAPVDKITLKFGAYFNHATHLSYSCTTCHPENETSGKIPCFGKVWAHNTCKGCHSAEQKGGTACNNCHVSIPLAKTVSAAAISVTQSSDNSYVIYGSGLEGVAGIDLNISYDSALLSSPTVQQGVLISGAMLVSNTSRPGSIRIAIITPTDFTGSGPIVTITFASNNGATSLPVVTASLFSATGSLISAPVTDILQPPPNQPPSGVTFAHATSATTIPSQSISVVPTYTDTSGQLQACPGYVP